MGDAIAFANYLDDATGFGITINQGNAQTIPVDLPGVTPFSAFDVNNIREIVITPDGKYAFVTGWNAPSQEIRSHNHFYPAKNPAGSTVGIIKNPFGSPKLVASTRSIPAGFPHELALTPDGKYLYVTYGTVSVQAASGGAVFVYNVEAMLRQVEHPANANLLGKVGVNDLVNGQKTPNSAIDVKADYRIDIPTFGDPTFKNFDANRSPIGLGGNTRGIAIQGAQITAAGQLGDVNEIKYAN